MARDSEAGHISRERLSVKVAEEVVHGTATVRWATSLESGSVKVADEVLPGAATVITHNSGHELGKLLCGTRG